MIWGYPYFWNTQQQYPYLSLFVYHTWIELRVGSKHAALILPREDDVRNIKPSSIFSKPRSAHLFERIWLISWYLRSEIHAQPTNQPTNQPTSYMIGIIFILFHQKMTPLEVFNLSPLSATEGSNLERWQRWRKRFFPVARFASWATNPWFFVDSLKVHESEVVMVKLCFFGRFVMNVPII